MGTYFPFILFLSSFSLIVSAEEKCSWRFKSNPEDCGSFLVCDFGREIVQRCPRGLHWNSRVYTCDWRRSAMCDLAMTLHIAEGNDVGEEVEEGQRVGVFRENCEGKEQYKPHPTDCSKYYVCNHGTYQEMTCSANLVWNQEIKGCDWAASVPSCSSGGGGPNPPQPPPSPTVTPAGSSVGPPAPPPDDGDVAKPPAPPPVVPSSTPRPKPHPTPTQPTGQGTDPTIVPIITGPASASDALLPEPTYKMICYFTGWSTYRPGEGKYTPKHVPPNLCTHYVYAFAILDYNWTIKSADTWIDIDQRFYKEMTKLRKMGKKVTIALGGWNDSQGQKYSLLLRDPAKIQTLINSVVTFMREHDFDGIDLDYEYPACPQGECREEYASDKNGFTILVKGLREALPKGSTISAAVSANKDIIDKAYDIRTLSESLDWIGVMDYDMHGAWEKETGHIAPLYYHPEDRKAHLNVNYSIHHWIQGGARPEKLVMGVPLYGQAFTLKSNSEDGLYAPISGPGQAGEFSRQNGILSFYEICSRDWDKRVEDPEGRMGPFLVKGNQWVSYDDAAFIQKKMQFVKEMGLGGAMAWALDFDDFNNKCGQGTYPLLKAMQRALATKDVVVDGDGDKPEIPVI